VNFVSVDSEGWHESCCTSTSAKSHQVWQTFLPSCGAILMKCRKAFRRSIIPASFSPESFACMLIQRLRMATPFQKYGIGSSGINRWELGLIVGRPRDFHANLSHSLGQRVACGRILDRPSPQRFALYILSTAPPLMTTYTLDSTSTHGQG
jgi:hypothetical protein